MHDMHFRFNLGFLGTQGLPTSLLARSYSALRSSRVTAALSLCSSASRVTLALYVRNTCARACHATLQAAQQAATCHPNPFW